MNDRDKTEINARASSSKFKVKANIEFGFWNSLASCSMIALGLLLSALLFPNAIFFGNIFSYAGVVVLIWVLNFILRPFLVLFTLPLIILTFGAGMVFINALVIWIAAGLIPQVNFSSYLYALFSAFLIEIVSWAVAFFGSEKVRNKKKKDDDVIDV